MTIKTALENAADPLLLCDGSGKLIWFNPSAKELLNIGTQHNATLLDIFAGDTTSAILATRHYRTLEIKIKSSKHRELRQTMIVVECGTPDPDSIMFLLAFKSTPTESTHLAEREELLAMATHDLKNPLGAIFGYADILLDTQAGQGINAKQKEIITRVRLTASRAIDLVRNYQYLSQLQYGSHDATRTISDLNSVIQAVVDSTWREADDSPSIELVLATKKLPVRLEKVALERIIANLLGNAIKYSPRSGKVSLKTWCDDTCTYFQINNTESVIDPGDVTHIFERYHRGAHESSKPGSGLGLYIVKRILEHVKGTVQVRSTVSEGTTFTVRLPNG